MHSHFIHTRLVLLALLACSAAHATVPAFEGYAAASDEELDTMRGGFELRFNGMQLMLAFSLEQLTYINGQLVSSMKLNPIQLTLPATPAAGTIVAASAPGATMATTPTPVSELPATPPSVPPVQAQTEPASIPTPTPTVATQILNNQGVITLVQNGAGNSFTLPQSLSSLTTVIQNTVNDQVIHNLTVLNATLSIQQAAAAARLGAALNQALSASVPH